MLSRDVARDVLDTGDPIGASRSLTPLVIGPIIVTIACHIGLRTRGGTQRVARATTQAVVVGAVAVIAVDFFLTRLLITVLY